MKDRKINVDRPQLNASEVLNSKNFDAVVRNHELMSKPFYKQTWFFGTTGLASLGLIIGGTLAFQSPEEENPYLSQGMNTDAPPNLNVPENKLIVLNSDLKKTPVIPTQRTITVNLENNSLFDNTSTLDQKEKRNKELLSIANSGDIPDPVIVEALNDVAEIKEEKPSNPFLDMSPRISNKLGGNISRNELLDNKGITTEGDINIIHFELHLIDGLGGQVFEEDGNQLNQEMKDALESVGQGETIYFENIRGSVKNGGEVRLNPLRYVLIN